jgi:hypothetical protein
VAGHDPQKAGELVAVAAVDGVDQHIAHDLDVPRQHPREE